MIAFIKSFYLSQRFFIALSIISLLFLISYWIPSLYGIIWLLVLGLIVAILLEISMLYSLKGLKGERILPEKFSNSDDNPVLVQPTNQPTY